MNYYDVIKNFFKCLKEKNKNHLERIKTAIMNNKYGIILRNY